MTVLKANEVIKGLTKKGFALSEGNHKHLIFYFKGKKTSIMTKISHGGNEINDYHIGIMSKQVRLEKKQFVELVNCPLTTEQYLKELEGQGICIV